MDLDAAAPPVLVDFAPATFLQRGVAIGFTAPGLAGATACPGERTKLELVVPNQAGGAGVYILPWEGVWSLCRPTVHDCQLIARVGALRSITPASIRTAARAVAAEGLAGRPAAHAARQDSAAEDQARVLVNFSLLLELLRQNEPRDSGWVQPERDRPARIEERARLVMAVLATRLGCRQETLVVGLEELSGLLCNIGLGAQAEQAALPRLLRAIERLRREVAAWAKARPEHGSVEMALIERCAALTARAARSVLADARAPVSDLGGLLRSWLASPTSIATTMARPEWLLDGWERICLLWQETPPEQRAFAVLEILPLLPLLPAEVDGWVAFDMSSATEMLRHRRVVRRMEDWRTGVMLADLVARNEHVKSARLALA